MRFAIALDQNSSVPLHRQLYEEWRKGILTGRFRRAERVPSTRELAAALAVARSTVTAAYDQLAAEGYLESARGSGTFVCRELPDELLRPKHRPVTRVTEEPAVRLSRYGAGLEENFQYPAVPPGVIAFWQWRPDLSRPLHPRTDRGGQ
jgi:GntR family transcriptional regulator / MocR family aminotransferase